MPFDTLELQVQLNTCSFCSIPSSYTCAKCKKVSYCSKQHQKQHWKTHKVSCFPLVLTFSEEVGRCLVTTRDIKEGEIILKEAPIISGPHFGPSSPHSGQWPICLSCYREVTGNYSCSKCGWPLCGISCENDIQHKEFECKLFKEKNILESSLLKRKDCNFYEGVSLLRCLLLKKLYPEKWLKLMDLQSQHEESQVYKTLRKSSIFFVKELCGLEMEDEIDHVLGIIGINGFVSDDIAWFEENETLIRSGTYLYHLSSLPAHSCVPNCSWVIQPNSWIHFMASVPIKCGERINILYTSALSGTRERCECLNESKFFECNCDRCSDPTELNSYFSAVKCPSNCGGYLLLSSVQETWNCTECKLSLCTKKIEKILEEFDEKLEPFCNWEDKGFTWIEKLLKFLEKTNLHQNHFKIHDIENTIMERITSLLLENPTKDKKWKRMELKWARVLVELCLKGIELLNVIWPGLNRYRGRVLFCLQFGLTIILRQEAAQKQKRIDDADRMRNDLLKIMDIRRQVVETLKMEGDTIMNIMSTEPPEIQHLKGLLLDMLTG